MSIKASALLRSSSRSHGRQQAAGGRRTRTARRASSALAVQTTAERAGLAWLRAGAAILAPINVDCIAKAMAATKMELWRALGVPYELKY